MAIVSVYYLQNYVHYRTLLSCILHVTSEFLTKRYTYFACAPYTVIDSENGRGTLHNRVFSLSKCALYN
jgi:hypothetical protein